MTMSIADLLGFMDANVESSISEGVKRWGPGYAAHAWDCCIFVTDPQYRAKPIFFYRPYEAAWERKAADCLAWQAMLAPVKEKKEESGSLVLKMTRG